MADKELIALDEFANLRFQSGTSSLRSQIVTSNNPVGTPAGRGGRRNQPLSRKLAALEKKYDIQFKAVFVAIRELVIPRTEEESPHRLCALGEKMKPWSVPDCYFG